MILVTRLNGKQFYLNPHVIEVMESMPDTTIQLISEKKVLVKETPEEVIEKIIEYRKKIGNLGNDTTI